jgi:hypothetical protein
MRSFFLTISRFAVAAWVGAAALFVYETLLQIRSPELDSTTKSVLALLGFPAYYEFGFGLVLAALLAGLIARGHFAVRPWQMRLYLGLLILALALMVCDYVFIYRPLEKMTADVTQARPASFQTYHTASEWINAVHIGLCLLAALLIAWPNRSQPK